MKMRNNIQISKIKKMDQTILAMIKVTNSMKINQIALMKKKAEKFLQALENLNCRIQFKIIIRKDKVNYPQILIIPKYLKRVCMKYFN